MRSVNVVCDELCDAMVHVHGMLDNKSQQYGNACIATSCVDAKHCVDADVRR